MHIHAHYKEDEDDTFGDAMLVKVLGPDETPDSLRHLQRSRQDALYFDMHREEILVTYSEQWVAVYQEQVVAHAEMLHDLLSRIDADRIPRERAFIQYVCRDDEDLVICWP